MDDVNPRPQKRQRMDHLTESAESSDQLLPSSPLTSIPASSPPSSTLRPLPPQVLLLALPALLAHPPTHENYGLSLFLSLRAFRTCLELKALTPDVECRAWTGLAEVGLTAIESGYSTSGEHEWANGLEIEVEKAIGKGLLIAQKHPSLRPLRHQLTLLNAHFAFQSHNTKFARALLRRLIASFIPSDPPPIVYVAHLALITQLTSAPPPSTSSTSMPSTSPALGDSSASTPELQAALAAITTLSALAAQNRHPAIEQLACVLRVRVLIASGLWDLVGEALEVAERSLSLSFGDGDEGKPANEAQEGNKATESSAEALMRSYSITAQDVHESASPQSQSQSQPPSRETYLENAPAQAPPPKHNPPVPTLEADPLTLSLTAHILILGVVFYTHVGRVRSAEPRLAVLHTLMDGGALVGGANSDGIVEIPLPGQGSIPLRTTHPRTLFLLTFLVSAIAKRDPVGRRPKKRVFADCGVAQCREGRNAGGLSMSVPLWASLGDVEEIDQRSLRIEADLLCELVAVSIQRSDFDAAENHLATLIAHTRSHDFFPAYAARITLHHAHLAHAVGDTARAETCYRVAAHLDGAGPAGSTGGLAGGFTAAAARAGEALLRIGVTAARSPHPPPTVDGGNVPQLDAPTVALAKDALARCSANSSAPLPALAALISAAISRSHIIRSKSFLKHALALSGAAGDNHLRALILAVVGAQYVYTAPGHAMEVLAVCETLGAGMGASVKKAKEELECSVTEKSSGETKDATGNAPLRLWVGERFLELFKRAGKESRANKQRIFNTAYQSAVDRLATHRARPC
ncbi:hypothetical protein HYDPIDRAFT_132789 [Hydnomerulius pinastri MD-312]|uniref:Anaphase-promoting complex subunit 5 n=1 Tax=Hydnomerulius pinastri MD-312 TaxID=994086 RepID=A0A0C9WES5_9AGAM|nr:hypothetical protein HYDPIDRAFT_132789 [Hydnomerulius pinastri MD-312]